MADDSIRDDSSRDNGNVVQFPREIIVEQTVRFCRRVVDRLTVEIETADPNTRDGMLTIAMGELLLEHRRDDLRCGSACKRDPVSGVIGVQKGPRILMV